MVLHDYECPTCGKVVERIQAFEDRTLKCECGSIAKRIVSAFKRSQIDCFEPYHEENLGDDCPLVTSTKHLGQLCQERGLVSRKLVEGYRNYGRKREL